MRRVTFSDTNPSEKEFFEEYNKYNTSWWFILIVLFRCFVPFCLALQIGLFEFPESIDLYIKEVLNQNECNNEDKSNVTDYVNKMSKNCEKGTVVLWINILKSVALFVGAIFGGILSDLFGRRTISLGSSLIGTLSSWMLVFTTKNPNFVILHMIVVANGAIVNALTLINCTEISDKRYRYLILYTTSFYPLGRIVGDILARNILVWKFLLFYIAVVNSITILVSWYIPESPRWLYTTHKTKKVYQQLTDISGRSYSFQEVQDPQIGKKTFVHLMLSFLLRKKRNNFLILCLSTFAASLTYHSARLSEVLRYVKTREFVVIVYLAEILGYVLFLPVYDFLWKRCGLFFLFTLIFLKAVIALFINYDNETIYYNAFGILFGRTAICLNWLYLIEIFPTFVRTTVIGCSFGIFAVTGAISGLLVDEEILYKIICYGLILIMSFLGTAVLFLPENGLQELLNYKPK